jgi:diguanylate cyclase (GGDEF)-like protein/PAS domain S-box-containing protein
MGRDTDHHRQLTELTRSLEESERTFTELTEHLEQCVWIKDPSAARTGRMAFVSSAFETIFGLTPESLHDRPQRLFELILPEDQDRFKEANERQFEQRYDVEYRITRASDGAVRWIWSRASPIRDAEGRIIKLVGVSEDITERKAAENRIRELNRRLERMYRREQEMSRTDPLTGLGNRKRYEEALDRLLKRTRRAASKAGQARWLALILIDVDHFKQINDAHGHATGDLCLQRVAAVLQACVREVDVSTRPGGDEFAVLLPNTSLAEAERVAKRICEELGTQDLSHQADSAAEELTLSGSFGVAATDGLSDEAPGGLYERADGALYRAKAAGRGRVEVARSDGGR